MKIALADGGNPANKGDAACYLGSLKVVRKAFPDAEIRYFSDNPKKTIEDLGLISATFSKFACPHLGLTRKLPHDKFRLAVRALTTFLWFMTNCDGFLNIFEEYSFKEKRYVDIYISKCGGNINDYYWSGMYYNLLWYWLLKREGRKVVILAQSIDPIKNKVYRFLLRHVLNRLDLITVRDPVSLENLKDLKVNMNKVHLTADLSFTLDPPKSKGFEIKKPAVCISTRYWKWNKNEKGYRDSINCLVKGLQANGYNIYWLSTGWAYPYEDWKHSINLLREGYHFNAGTMELKEPTLDELRATLKKFDLVVATRMHMSILSLAQNVPCVAIYYETKALGLFKSLGLRSLAININQVQPDFLLHVVTFALKFKDEIKSTLKLGVPLLKEKAWSNVELLRSMAI